MPVDVSRSGFLAAALLAGAAALVTGGAGCMSVRKELQSEQVRREADWRQRHPEPPDPAPQVALGWNQALTRLRSSNEKILGSDLDCLRADENLRQIKRSLIPLLNVQAGYNRALTSGTQIDPFTFATSVFFDVPSMVGYRLRRETAELVIVRSRLAREAVWREQVVELYRAFSRSAELTREQRSLDAALQRTTAPEAATYRAGLEHRRLASASAGKEAAAQVSALLGAPGTIFVCSGDDLPALEYDTPAGRPPASVLAQLPLKLAAVELVGLRARELGVNLQYWPELNIYVNSPAIYSRNGGEDRFWSSRDVFAGANVYWTLDTRGRRSGQKRLIIAEAALRREALEQESTRLSLRITGALAALAETDNRLSALRAATPPAGSLTLQSALSQRRAALESERREWQLVLWFFDDTRWPGIPPLPTLPRLAAL